MSLVTEYVILITETPIHMEEVMENAIEDGFQPLGAPFFAEGGWSQAVVKLDHSQEDQRTMDLMELNHKTPQLN